MKLNYTVVYKVVHSFLADNRKEADQIARENLRVAELGLNDGGEMSAIASILEEVRQGK